MFSDTNPPPAWTFSWFRNSKNANLNVFFILDFYIRMKISYCILPCNLSNDSTLSIPEYTLLAALVFTTAGGETHTHTQAHTRVGAST